MEKVENQKGFPISLEDERDQLAHSIASSISVFVARALKERNKTLCPVEAFRETKKDLLHIVEEIDIGVRNYLILEWSNVLRTQEASRLSA